MILSKYTNMQKRVYNFILLIVKSNNIEDENENDIIFIQNFLWAGLRAVYTYIYIYIIYIN